MSLANGNPVFQSVGGTAKDFDASAATVLPTGGAKTVVLSDLAATVASNATGLQSVSSEAASAVTKSAAALSQANAAIPSTSLGEANGVAALDANGDLVALGSINIGSSAQGGGTHWVRAYTAPAGSTGTSYDAGFMFVGQNGTGNNDGRTMLVGSSFEPLNDNQTALGSAGNRISQVYAASGSINTSDVTTKTDIKVLLDTAGLATAQGAAAQDDEVTKLLAVGRKIPITVFTFKDEGTRRHVGTLAQAIQAAFASEGLDAANYGMWCEDKLYDLTPESQTVTEQVSNADGTTGTRQVEQVSYVNKPRLNEDGTQATLQSVRMDEVMALKLVALEVDFAALAAKSGA
ncbi:tail fiber domain-containing protein [Gluconobacter cerinus]|uniref:tail fiber domain-containing protein n=1 Tax=Gluconobacter cerinus TaxID=38307 RepID=UPI001B8CF880|nr:tail fiber domain-containing protein [Gluconobacter cerinus]MBS0995865.1 tail fiber domain-containing protein [Gluconobacter cerinus]